MSDLQGDTIITIDSSGDPELVQKAELAVNEQWYSFQSYDVDDLPLNETAVRNTALVLVVGGDGTFLEGVRLATQADAPVLGVNAGSLGFLARVAPDNLSDAVCDALAGDAEMINRQMLEVSGPMFGTGVNDVMIEPQPPESPTDRKIVTLHAYIDDEYVGQYDGSGLAVSTPTGSTAVAFSAGGPVHYPENNTSLQLTPLHTHNAGVRPVVVDSSAEITIRSESPVKVAIDGGRMHESAPADTEIRVTAAAEPARVVRTQYDESFFDAMAEKLGWGIL